MVRIVFDKVETKAEDDINLHTRNLDCLNDHDVTIIAIEQLYSPQHHNTTHYNTKKKRLSYYSREQTANNCDITFTVPHKI